MVFYRDTPELCSDWVIHFFKAFDENQLVDGYRIAAKVDKVKVFIIVNPTNPLNYTFSRDAAKEINSIAEKNGIEVIVDDILRGNQPFGERESYGILFSKPYIVESMAKRFGTEPFGNISYVLTQPGKYIVDWQTYDHEDCLCGEAIHLEQMYSSAPIMEELKQRNEAFDNALLAEYPDAKITRSSPVSLISQIDYNAHFGTAREFSVSAYYQGFDVRTVFSFVPHELRREFLSSDNFLRITVGPMDIDQITYGATALGNALQNRKENNSIKINKCQNKQQNINQISDYANNTVFLDFN